MFKNPLLIFVDDESDLKGLYQILLTHALSNDYNFIFFSKPSDCISFLMEHSIEYESIIVITDISMPDMDGYELLEHIVSNFKNVDVVVSSGYDEEEMRIKAFDLGAIDYIRKPVDFTKIGEIIKQKTLAMNKIA